jgi:hypothetical protein
VRFSDNLSNIATALAKIQAEIKNPIKDQINKGVQGAPKYANLEDTLQDYVRPICSRHGVSIFQSIKTDEDGRVGVCTVLFHESGEFIEGDYVYCDIVIPISREGKKVLTEGQATGVCITYLRRYSLNAALGINGDKDTDGSFADDVIPPFQSPLAPRKTSKGENNVNATTTNNAQQTGANQTSKQINVCPICGGPITDAESNYSKSKFGKEMCRKCQRSAQ